jgi:hypothetical protein
MNQEIQSLLYKAEADYLQHQDLELFQKYIKSLKTRMAVYKFLRDSELQIFQPIADEMVDTFPDEEQPKVYQTIKHWVSVLRCCGMAMLLNDPAYLKDRLLDWLAPQVQAYQMQSLDRKLFSLLLRKLEESLVGEQFVLLEPFLKQAKQTLLESSPLSEALL